MCVRKKKKLVLVLDVALKRQGRFGITLVALTLRGGSHWWAWIYYRWDMNDQRENMEWKNIKIWFVINMFSVMLTFISLKFNFDLFVIKKKAWQLGWAPPPPRDPEQDKRKRVYGYLHCCTELCCFEEFSVIQVQKKKHRKTPCVNMWMRHIV